MFVCRLMGCFHRHFPSPRKEKPGPTLRRNRVVSLPKNGLLVQKRAGIELRSAGGRHIVCGLQGLPVDPES